jgi:intein/homing endonuclease
MSKALVDRIRVWRDNPVVFVRECFGVEPDAWQVETLMAYSKHQRVGMKAAKGVGKAQPKSMIFDTPTGKTRWGDIKVGDYVFAPDGSPTRVSAVYDRGVLPTYRVYFDDGSFTECCGDHLWSVRGADERRRKHKIPYQRDTKTEEIWSTLSTEEIIKRGVRVKNGKWAGRQFEIPRHSAVQFPFSHQPIDSYVMGVWLGDGTAASGMFTGIDHEVDDEIIRRGYSLSNSGRISKTIYGISVGLRKIGLLGVNSQNRFIPDCYKYASVQQRKDLLTGLMDTDGFVGKDNGSMEYGTTSKQLADDVVWLVRSLGGRAVIKDTVKKAFYYGKDGERIDCRDCYRVTIRTDFCPFLIKRKVDRWIPADNASKRRYLKRYIDRIESVGEQDVMCITVDHSSSCYLANDFIVTHNTTALAWMTLHFLICYPMPNIAVTSVSEANLKDGLWKELALWMGKSPLFTELFTWTKTRIYAKSNPETWFVSARTWTKSSDNNALGNTLAGLHADHIMFVLDESSSMPNAIMSSAEAALSSAKVGKLLQAGNPTHLSGPLYTACTTSRHLWWIREITSDPDDPMRSPRVDIEWAREQIKIYGRDNDFIKISILGQFPNSSLNSLIGYEEVREAMEKHIKLSEYQNHAIVLGVDVAREGGDCFSDDTEILTNEGWKLFPDLHGNEKVFSMEHDKASWEAIDKIHCYDFNGELNLLESKHLNFCITDNHRLLVRSHPVSDRYVFKTYSDLPQNFVIRKVNGWSGKSPKTIKFNSSVTMPNGGLRKREWEFNYLDWALLLGWFVSEGCVYQETRKNGRMRTLIAQNPGKKQDMIVELLTRMGIQCGITGMQDQQVEFSIAPIGEYLKNNCGVGAYNKKVPDEIKNGSEQVIRNFLDSFLLGDGTCKKDGTGRSYITSSPQLADDIHEMLSKLGCAGLKRTKEAKGSIFYIGDRKVIRKHDTFVIYESSHSHGKCVHKRDVKKVYYKGKIWCVSTKFQSIYVRRKGVPMWSGNSSTICTRQGNFMSSIQQYRQLDGIQGAGIVARHWRDIKADACFVDNTGGFGGSWIDQLHLLGYSPIGIHYAGKAASTRYANKRAEMAFEFVQWIKAGGVLPQDDELLAELTQTCYAFKGDSMILEPKYDVKVKLGRSPDKMDCAMLSFAQPIFKENPYSNMGQHQHKSKYDPFSPLKRK